jgi:hypothetical protein
MTLRTEPSDRDLRTRSAVSRNVDLGTRYVTVCVVSLVAWRSGRKRDNDNKRTVFWDVTLYIVVDVYQRGSKKIPAARNLKSWYLSTQCHWPSSQKTAVQWLLAATDGKQYREGATVSTATPHPLQSQLSVTWPQFVCGSEFLAGCSQRDEFPTTQSCVQLSALEINWTENQHWPKFCSQFCARGPRVK